VNRSLSRFFFAVTKQFTGQYFQRFFRMAQLKALDPWYVIFVWLHLVVCNCMMMFVDKRMLLDHTTITRSPNQAYNTVDFVTTAFSMFSGIVSAIVRIIRFAVEAIILQAGACVTSHAFEASHYVRQHGIPYASTYRHCQTIIPCYAESSPLF
jgi:hypothetical protein